MPAEAGLLLHPAAEGVRLLARKPLDDADAAVRALRAEGSEAGDEAVHDLRVALRRVRSLLRAYEPQFADTVTAGMRRRLRKLARRTGEVRDADVLLAWLGRTARRLPAADLGAVRALSDRLHRQRRAAMERLLPRLERRWPELHGRLGEALATYTATATVGAVPALPTLAAVAAPLVREHAATLALTAAAFAATPEELATAHEARIAGKRLRYLLEPLADHVAEAGAAVGRLRRLQDSLGAVQDAAVRAGALQAAAGDGQGAGVGIPGSLAAVMEAEQAEALERVKRRELPGLRRVLRLSTAAAEALEALAGAGVEIERKFLLRRLPPRLRRQRSRVIEQGYLPGERLVERLRRETAPDGTVRRWRTVKGGEGIARLEIEEATDEALFDALWPHTEGRRVLKRRHVVPDGALRWEIDEFTDRDLVLAEVELPDAQAQPELPAWLAPYVEREVTGERAYVNAVLAR